MPFQALWYGVYLLDPSPEICSDGGIKVRKVGPDDKRKSGRLAQMIRI